ncbi:benzaldehyde dehydrogenase [Novosphingobium sp. 1949]|uniref:Benzaldehyde dehydrogenase n=1 Tax=Novosphingobium organovorum TaxID=2930092 RepID=A0ABT0BBY6_9SPHN|nr:benzaldehyde dehydrogenase [Novosphingobium organovorum]MCJ2182484.1 benzaldehyde dehydrogenase [Novosphingobium organovorum]
MEQSRVLPAGSLIPDKYLSGMFYGNGWVAGEDLTKAIEPATGTELGTIALANADTVAGAAKAARSAQRGWAAMSADERAAIFLKALAIGQQFADDIIAWIVRESGSARAKAAFELQVTLKAIQLAAAMPHQAQGLVLPTTPGRVSLARRRPLGVVGIIAPFNFPLYLAVRAVAPALAVGNAVILKPDPRTAICGGLVIARLFELAGLPADVLHVLPGGSEAGEALCSDSEIGMIQFTGSTGAGRMVGQNASRHLKKVSLELGGKNSIIVLDDADIDLALRNVTWGVFLHQGQICMSAGRVLVHEAIAADFVKALGEKAAALPIGDPSVEGIAIGPLINQRQADHVAKVVKESIDAGATLITGGKADRLFYTPTVLANVTPEMSAFREEIFGPVAVVTTFADDAEAIRLANQTEYGLSAAIQSRNVSRAMAMGEQLRTGLLHINDQTVNDDVVNPFGGVGASGNGSAVGGPANWEEFTEWQWVTIKGEAPAYPF